MWPPVAIDSADDLPPEWRDSYPYGVPATKTCAEILAREEEPESVEVLKVKLSDVDATQMPSTPLMNPAISDTPKAKKKKP